ncbi:hypothetical protein, conserved [Babesia ovata]|uniref:C3H1-type domain-containing protein n=1 Tax=Babesia ovata TaxID=189622 RepID=A0A2H6KJM0_9APIC|nr:uncharacterized protein BOVATA_046880 [Babesia ovata]GBE63195.1 hypothetical protein, conserved [Babesia ovata]
MSFLLQCLQGSEPLLKHYYRDITTTISDLEGKIGKGHGVQGFAQAIESVRQGLREYEGGMRDKSKKVVDDVTAIQSNFTILREYLDNVNTKNLQVQLQEVQKYARLYWVKASLAEEARKLLDETLKGKLDKHVSLVVQAADGFKRSAEDGEVGKAAAAMDRELLQQKNNITIALNSGISVVHNTIDRGYENVQNSIESLSNVKTEQINNVKYAVSSAKTLVDGYVQDFDNHYKTPINHMFAEIKTKLDALDSSKKKPPQLREEMNKISSAVVAVGNDLSGKSQKLHNWISAAEKTMHEALTKVEKILEQVDGEKALNKIAIEGAVHKLKGSTQQHFIKLKQEELKCYAYQAMYALENLGTEVLKVVDENFMEAEEQCRLLVSQGLNTLSRSATGHADVRIIWAWTQAAQNIISIVHNIDEVVKQFVQRNSQSFRSVQVDSSLSQLQQTQQVDTILQGGYSSIAPNQLPQHQQMLSNITSAVKTVLQASIDTLITEIKNGMPSFSNVSITSDFRNLQNITKPVHTALHSASQFAQPLYEKLQLLTGRTHGSNRSSSFHNIREAYSQLSSLIHSVKQFGGDFTQDKTFMEEFDTGITTPFTQITQVIKQAAGKDTADGLKNVLTSFETQKIGKYDESVHGSTPPSESLGDVHKQLKELYTCEITEPGRIQQAIGTALETVGKLEPVPEQVVKAQQVVDKSMQQLEEYFTTLREKIALASSIVDTVEKQLTQKIDLLDGAFHEATDSAKKAITKLRDDLTLNVQQSFSTLTHQVHSLFAKQKQAELTQLQTVVTAQLAEITSIIEKDKTTGVKGFLGKMKTYFVDTISDAFPMPIPGVPSKDIQTKLEDIADVARESLEGFFALLQKQSDFISDYSKVQPPADALLVLVNGLKTSKHFDHTFSKNLDSLNKSLSAFNPSKFENGKNPLIFDIIKDSMTALVKQLEYAYVSAYSEQTVEWEHKPKLPDFMVSDGVLSNGATKCAKVFCTIINPLYDELSQLGDNCRTGGKWEHRKIDLSSQLTFSAKGHTQTDTNPLGDFLKRCGFGVSTDPNICTSELVNKSNMSGSAISGKLETQLSLLNTIIKINDIDYDSNVKVMDLLEYFRELLRNFYRVTQVRHIPAAKAPNTVYHMLQWLCGFRYNPMQTKVNNYFVTLFGENKDALEVSVPDEIQRKLPSYMLSPSKLIGALTLTCRHAEKVLSAIVGYGNAEGRYGCDYNTNPDDLSYPTSPATCFDWLVEICSRLHHQLYFLYYQCCNGNSSSGWLDCHYGNGVGGSAWNCNDEQCANQKCKQIVKQNCRQHPRCGLKSPLQSFLEDGLQGFLPHPFKKPDCKMSCSVANHRGIPCKTPMGFRNISTVASHTMRGQHLMKALAGFCSNPDKPLTKLCGYLTCLLQKPPQTLDEMLAFYYSFLSGWSNSGPHRKDAFQTAVDNAYFGNSYKQLNPESICDSATHRDDNHPHGDISSIINCNEKSSPVSPCGSYIHPVSLHSRCIYSQEHADKYLSWIVYLTEAFYNYLCRLLTKCEETCGKNTSKCRADGCANDCRNAKSATHSSTWIVFGNNTKIGGRLGKHLKRTCGDFIEQLKKVCGGKSLIAKLIHETIPEYIWTIRQPFSYLLLALWSLSLLYLLHITVVRLDVLRIRSHLRSPSSHRIAAQSLLAVAKVGKIANVKYFSP